MSSASRLKKLLFAWRVDCICGLSDSFCEWCFSHGLKIAGSTQWKRSGADRNTLVSVFDQYLVWVSREWQQLSFAQFLSGGDRFRWVRSEKREQQISTSTKQLLMESSSSKTQSFLNNFSGLIWRVARPLERKCFWTMYENYSSTRKCDGGWGQNTWVFWSHCKEQVRMSLFFSNFMFTANRQIDSRKSKPIIPTEAQLIHTNIRVQIPITGPDSIWVRAEQHKPDFERKFLIWLLRQVWLMVDRASVATFEFGSDGVIAARPAEVRVRAAQRLDNATQNTAQSTRHSAVVRKLCRVLFWQRAVGTEILSAARKAKRRWRTCVLPALSKT